MSQVLTLELSDEIYAALQQQAEISGLSIPTLVASSLERFYLQPKKRRQSGSAKGLIWMSPDFDQPLEDFSEYMG